VFAPERWLSSSGNQHSHQFAFGIGGRMCVAFNLAHKALYTVFLHLIAHYHVLPADGTTVEEIDPLLGLRGLNFVAAPRGYRARFVPREAEKLGIWLSQPNGGCESQFK
jgi:3-hydroxyphenylacetate 6-hydroxylase